MKTLLPITGDWVLTNFPRDLSSSIDPDFGDISYSYISTDNIKWYELVFETYKIPYKYSEFVDKDFSDEFFGCFSVYFKDMLKYEDEFPEAIKSILGLHEDYKTIYHDHIMRKKLHKVDRLIKKKIKGD
jgi:hypothetical protein